MNKIEVDSFEGLVVAVNTPNLGLILIHGDENVSKVEPGLIVSREAVNFVVLEPLRRVEGHGWHDYYNSIVHKGTGETLREYREQRVAWLLDYITEDLHHPSSKEVSPFDAPVSSTGDVSPSIGISVSSEPSEVPSSTL